jgi:histidinol dehydrogenase
MIKIFKDGIKLKDILNREIESYSEFEAVVDDIIKDVISSGDEAVLRYTRKFDCPTLENLEVSKEEIDKAYERLDKDFLEILKEAKENIETFHRKQLREGFRFEKEGGIVLGQKFTHIKRVGIYVPGGTAAYPSTVLMNAIPAVIAGVKEIIMVTPAGKDGRVKDEILAAAKLAGVNRVFRIGGAQAVAALSYGTETIPKVHKIVGPGNIFVALAKKRVFGTVSIDMIAGPSEILVIADKTANPKFLASDLLSQAEHDRLASAVLVTDSLSLAKEVSEELERQIPLLSRSEIARHSIDNQGKIIVTSSIDEAIEISNEIAPEHLEICVDDPFKYLDKIENAGSIFLGKYTPEPLGDYFAGPNHTLPTSGSAKFSSPLSVDDFVKKSSFIYYPEEKLRESAEKIAEFATREGLTAHAKSVTIRFED